MSISEKCKEEKLEDKIRCPCCRGKMKVITGGKYINQTCTECEHTIVIIFGYGQVKRYKT